MTIVIHPERLEAYQKICAKIKRPSPVVTQEGASEEVRMKIKEELYRKFMVTRKVRQENN